MKKLYTLLVLCLVGVMGAWAEDVYTILYGVATYTDETITGVTPQTDFTSEDGNTASDVTSADANGDNCTNAMPIGGSTLYSSVSFAKSFETAATKGVVHFEANYTATTNGQETWKIVDSNGVEIFGTTDCGFSNGNATENWGFSNGESLGTGWFRQARKTHNRVVLDINLSTKVVSYTVLVSSGANSYTTLNGTYNLPSGVSDVKGLTATKQTYYSYMDNVSFYNVYDNAVAEAPYTINYNYDNATIKTSTGSMAIGGTVSAESPIVIDGVRYYAVDGATTSKEIVDGENVLNVTLRLANTYNYTVNAVDGSANVLETLLSGTYTEGDAAISLFYPRCILSGTNLYTCGTGAIAYSVTFTPDADNYVKEIAYNSGTVSDVVYYSEGEAVSGVSVGNNTDRASVGKMGYTGSAGTYVEVTSIEIGKYKIYARGQNGNSAARAFNFKVGEDIVFTGSITNGTNKDFESDEVDVAASSTLSFACEGSSASGIDYFYLVRTGDLTEQISVNSTGASSYVTTYALDFSEVEGLTALVATAESENSIVLEKVTEVPAGTPIIVRGTPGETYDVPVGTCTEAPAVNLLSGSPTESKNAGDYSTTVYALKNTDGAFHPVAATVTIPAKVAYLVSSFSGSASAKAMVVLGEEETAVTAVEAAKETAGSRLYNAAGQQVGAGYKGLVIDENGKKYIK